MIIIMLIVILPSLVMLIIVTLIDICYANSYCVFYSKCFTQSVITLNVVAPTEGPYRFLEQKTKGVLICNILKSTDTSNCTDITPER